MITQSNVRQAIRLAKGKSDWYRCRPLTQILARELCELERVGWNGTFISAVKMLIGFKGRTIEGIGKNYETL